jgi:hypothetical protein
MMFHEVERSDVKLLHGDRGCCMIHKYYKGMKSGIVNYAYYNIFATKYIICIEILNSKFQLLPPPPLHPPVVFGWQLVLIKYSECSFVPKYVIALFTRCVSS